MSSCPGIRHRRRQLGQELHGRPDAIVLSIFEDSGKDTTPKRQPTYQNRDPASVHRANIAIGSQCKIGFASSSSKKDEDWSECSSHDLERIRKVALRELPHHIGLTSPGYHAACSHFDLKALLSASECLRLKLIPTSIMESADPNISVRSPSFSSTRGRSLSLDPAEIVCLGSLVHRDLGLEKLCIQGDSSQYEV